MLNLKTAIDTYYEDEDDMILISYLCNASTDELIDEAESLNIDLAYEDIMRMSVHALAELILDQV